MNRPASISSIANMLIGLVPVIIIGAAAWEIGTAFPILGGPVVAILIGLVFGQIFGERKEFAAGIKFASRTILQSSIVLLGTGMSLKQVATIGGNGLPVMIGTLILCVAAGIVIGRGLNVERETRILITYGTAICGASAIATMSAVIGASGPAIAVSVTVIVLYNVLAAILFPTLGHMMGLSPEAFGMWAGTAINDTSSVMAAATVYGALAASYAVVVKLTRTLAIVPLAIFQTWFQNKQLPYELRKEISWYKLVPSFMLIFLAATAINSIGIIPESWSGILKFLSHFGITVAMAAIGMSSSLNTVKCAGSRPLVLGGILWIAVAISSLALQWLTGHL